MSERSADATEYPPDWPPGVDEENLCENHCDYCDDLWRRLEKHRDGLAANGDHRSIASFAQS